MKPYNKSLYSLKAVLALLIVCLHSARFFNPEVFDWIMPLTRIAVPLFFMISGYFFFTDDRTKLVERCKKAIIKTLIITLCVYPLYLRPVVDMQEVWAFLLVNVPIASRGTVLWYMFAYIYVLSAVWLATRLNVLKWMSRLAPLLLLAALSLGAWQFLFHLDTGIVYCRNWLLMGLPFFFVGWNIRKYKALLMRMKTPVIVTGILIGIAASLAEYWYVADKTSVVEIFGSTILLSFMVFCLCIKHDSMGKAFIVRIGREDSVWIYVLHYFIIIEISKLASYIHLDLSRSGFLMVPLVFIICVVLARGINYLKNKLKPLLSR